MQTSANLNVMVKAARKAGRSLMKDFQEVENLQVSVKGAGDFVTKADIAAEKIIKDELLQARPTYGWVGEESGEIEGADPTRRWIVDPLDGTTNFLHGLPHWSVSIALEHKGQVVAGVVHDPIKNELFFAEKGSGAWMNETRLRVSGRNRMIEAVFATGLPFAGRADLPTSLRDLGRLLPVCAGVRQSGSAALDLSYVAAGRFDGFWEFGLQPWDMAAGALLIQEAGGLVSGLHGANDFLETGNIVAGNPKVFKEMLQRLHPIVK